MFINFCSITCRRLLVLYRTDLLVLFFQCISIQISVFDKSSICHLNLSCKDCLPPPILKISKLIWLLALWGDYLLCSIKQSNWLDGSFLGERTVRFVFWRVELRVWFLDNKKNYKKSNKKSSKKISKQEKVVSYF